MTITIDDLRDLLERLTGRTEAYANGSGFNAHCPPQPVALAARIRGVAAVLASLADEARGDDALALATVAVEVARLADRQVVPCHQ